MHHHPAVHTAPSLEPQQRSMADLWNEFPADPTMMMHAAPAPEEEPAPPASRPKPYRDPTGWMLLKHVVQLALVCSVLLFVVYGGNAPLMALGYVVTGLLLMGVAVLADRQRFADRDPNFEIVKVIPPPPRPVAPLQPAAPPGALAPLVQQMQTAIQERVEVT